MSSAQKAAARLPFGEYAAVYDLIYQDKNYSAEADFVSGFIEQLVPGRPETLRVIDLACGTGRHVFELAKRGYQTEGSDISADMVGIARQAARTSGLGNEFHNESFQTASSIGRRYDVALALFASLGYLTTDDDLQLALENIRGLLVHGGIFIFDVWNGDAVVRDFSPRRVKQAEGHGLRVTRVSRTTLNPSAKIAEVSFQFEIRRADGTASQFEECHRVRFFYADELEKALRSAGFSPVLHCPFLAPNRQVTPSDWNMTYVARHE